MRHSLAGNGLRGSPPAHGMGGTCIGQIHMQSMASLSTGTRIILLKRVCINM